MARIPQFLVATGTFSVALGIGFVMQNGDALAARFNDAPPAQISTPTDIVTAAPVAALTGPANVHMSAPTVVANLAINVPDTMAAPELAAITLTDEPAQTVFAVPDMSFVALELPAMDAAPVLLAGLTDTPMPAPTAPPVLLAAADAVDVLPPAMQNPLAQTPACNTTLTATAKPAAMVDLVLTASCSPEARVTFHHQGMIFSMLTDDAGQALVAVPALAESAVFIADLGKGDGSVAVTTVPDFGSFDRAVLQWQGGDGPEIHALEFGAAYGEAGHVWHGAGRSPAVALGGTGGFLVRLGDGLGLNPMMAEIYTFPSSQSRTAGEVAISIETPVTVGNCGTQIQAQTIQVSPGAEPFAFDLTMAVPACDAVGEFLVLKNMLMDLTLAAK